MGHMFEELDLQPTPIGELSLRRRRIPTLGERDIYEVKLGEEFLMSSLFVDAEVALAELGLAAVQGNELQVVVGGLGLGYTAEAALQNERVGELLIVEALAPVIQWHQQGLVPLGRRISDDFRTRYIHASFFDCALGEGFDPKEPQRLFDAILLDIDHSPSAHLDSANASFYSAAKLAQMARQLKPSGLFAMWSNEAADENFMATLRQVFAQVESQVVSFYNPFQDANASNTIYVAKTAAA